MPAPIFITARFRSGSTMLWAMFDRLDRFCAFYEPLHDSLLPHIEHTRPMESHRGVVDYWGEYRRILSDVQAHHKRSFGISRLLLEGNDDWPELEAYLRALIEAAGDRTAVLQFNRIDLRLPWIRARFPEARIVHLYRDPRDAYASMMSASATATSESADLVHVFDVLEWCIDLAGQLPFLIDPQPRSFYERCYALACLSRIMGTALSDTSIDYTRDFEDPAVGVERLIRAGLITEQEADRVIDGVDPARHGQWAELHDETEFVEVEERVERELDRRGLTGNLGKRSVAEIRRMEPGAWRDDVPRAQERAMRLLQECYSQQRSEVTRLLHIVRHQNDLQSGDQS